MSSTLAAIPVLCTRLAALVSGEGAFGRREILIEAQAKAVLPQMPPHLVIRRIDDGALRRHYHFIAPTCATGKSHAGSA